MPYKPKQFLRFTNIQGRSHRNFNISCRKLEIMKKSIKVFVCINYSSFKGIVFVYKKINTKHITTNYGEFT